MSKQHKRLSSQPVCIHTVVDLMNDAFARCDGDQEVAFEHLVGATAVLAAYLGVSPKRAASLVKSNCQGAGPVVVKGLEFDPNTPHTTPGSAHSNDTPSVC
jgi:hypothetical protein